jgi:hypothetical protein
MKKQQNYSNYRLYAIIYVFRMKIFTILIKNNLSMNALPHMNFTLYYSYFDSIFGCG